ncbi:ABC-type organic anion transporter ABCA8-like isoform X2 [Pseudophryne corroboree]|uniref:ABC-type organic anion transporter ABCA8-like isoform X2 n=1 Tax=Pseudophryne corroboree TaxID=495146 RepID=UPI003081DAF4
MTEGTLRETSLFQQTLALLGKHLLHKWRRKWHSVLEWLQNLAFVFLMFTVSALGQIPFDNEIIPAMHLGRLDAFKQENITVGYTPVTSTTKDIMQRLKGITIQEYKREDDLLGDVENQTVVAVVFDDLFKYHIQYHIYNIRSPNDYFASSDDVSNKSDSGTVTQYLKSGFLFLQANIDSAMIEMATKTSVEGKLTSIGIIRMKSTKYGRPLLQSGIFLVGMSMCYVSLMYLLSLYVTRERREMRETMKMMRLKDLAFWLSWGLLYSVYVIIIANLMTVITNHFVFIESSYGVIVLLFLLYGISSICFTFMLSALFRNPRVTAIAGFFITLFMSTSGLLLLMKNLPKVVEVLLSVFPPFAFSVGLAESIHLESDMQGVFFSDIMGDSSHVLSSCICLSLDSIFYMLLTLYFDKVLPDKNGRKYEPFFFLRSSYWSRDKMIPPRPQTERREVYDYDDYNEKVPSTLHGKEAIRISKIKKTYSGQDRKVEALRGLDFDIYEGQITALLGHSGAGKTTLLNILSGMCMSTSGSANIYNYDLSNMIHLEEIRKRVGFCPQYDVKFDPLTVKENLKVFAKIKGIPSNNVDREVQKVISDLQLTDVENLEANKLSGGQRRKLSLGIALLGDPQVLLLDEPTAGLDPYSRHHVWAILKERKADRAMLLSTQFMDEADILSDRKAVISGGKLKCVGTSLFLKRKWGIGYHLRMQVSPSCDPEIITSLVRQHIHTAKLSTKTDQEIIFTLPFENMDVFPDLFTHLDGHVGQNIVSYGVSMTTLNDVFLKLEGEAEIERGDYAVFNQEMTSEEDREFLNSEMEESIQLMSDSGTATVSGMALWRQQVLAVARIRFLKLRHDMKGFRALLLLLFLFIIPMIILFAISHNIKTINLWELKPDHYFLRSGDKAHKYYSRLLINNNTGAPIEDFIDGVKSQDIVIDVINGPYNINTTTYKGAIEVTRDNQSYTYTIVGNPRAQNALPVLVNIISNAFLKTFNSKEHIQIWNNPVLPSYEDEFHIYMFLLSMIFMVFASGMAPHFAMSSIDDTRIKARSQLRISGLYPSAYWFGQAMVDIPFYWLLLFVMISVLFIFNHRIIMDFSVALLLIFHLLGYGAAIVLYVYIFAFIFRSGKSHHDRWSFFFVMTSLAPLMLAEIDHPSRGPTPSIYYMFLFPHSALIELISTIGLIIEGDSYQVEHSSLMSACLVLLISYIHIILFSGILWLLEWRYGTRSLKRDPIFRTSKRKPTIKPNPEELEDADESVLAEREIVKHAKTTNNEEEKPVIIVDSLRKEFKVKTGTFSFKKKRRVATKNISFCVKKGEVLGLLGPNGAGKTTSIFMLAGDIKPTAGEVVLCELDLPKTRVSDESTAFLGYCCQNNPLWSDMTVKQHLEIYAAIKGMKKEDGDRVIKRVAEALELKEHLEKQTRKLSAGVSRKVCFAISMLGNPTIVLLDEPSTGLDPKGQQRLWRAIRAAFKNKDRGAILTTHYMEEAEAVCDRVAIMVSGKLRCIGSIQQLKSKFGKGYLLEIKVKDSHHLDVIHQEIMRLFPQAARQDRFSSLLVYKIPMDNVQSLSQAFLQLEEAKRVYNIEEYSFSQSTLEQVFLDLVKEQEKEDFNLDITFGWKHLRTESI